MHWLLILALVIFLALIAVAIYDITQKKHAILRNFPILGHFRYWLETIGPELRQYIVTDNDSERPFSRDQRRWIYASSKNENNYFGFGTDNNLDSAAPYYVIKHRAFPHPLPHQGDPDYDLNYPVPCAKVLGEARGRRRAFRPESVVCVSAMSYGSLGKAAVEALNKGCALSGCLHNTGEGGVSDHHLHGAGLVLQLGTAYFGCRDEKGRFSMEKLEALVETHPQIKAIEIKLSQGAKPALGGILPKEKITEEIARVRGIPMGIDCVSPSYHTAFRDVNSLLEFVELIGGKTGLPVGIKSAVGDLSFWEELTTQMATRSQGVDFVAIDGGEGGTGAAPLVFSDHVSLPFREGFARVYQCFKAQGLDEGVVFVGAGRLGLPGEALMAMAMGCDMIGVAREAMLAIGCIQAQRCHTGHCPAGVATHHPWLMRGLDPTLKAARLANYMVTFRKELLKLAAACGVDHPSKVTEDQFEWL